MTLTTPSTLGHATFLYSEPDFDLRLEGADIAFLGIPFGSGYSFAEQVPDQANAPAAMRAATSRILRSIERYDFDLGGSLYDAQAVRAVDCGDVRAEVGAPTSHVGRAEAAVRRILEAGAMPVVLGGDHAIPIPVLRAFEGRKLTLVQIDQHIDWRDEVNGVRDGLSSPIRRASEMAHVGEIFQIGLRATGSAREEEVDAARAYGAHLITATTCMRRARMRCSPASRTAAIIT
ncbi:MAG: arginase family protein [Mycobacteriaceae bacterium]|nr:arginase family protein [Mycobacteriaceae bacterium]